MSRGCGSSLCTLLCTTIFSSAPNPNQVPLDSRPTRFVPQNQESHRLPLDLDLRLTGAHEPVVGIIVVHRVRCTMIFFSVPNLNQVPRHSRPTQFVLQDLEYQGLPMDLDVELCEAHEPVVPKPVLRYGIHLCTGS